VSYGNLNWLYGKAPFTLNNLQQKFLDHFINVNKGHGVLVGEAGSGKSAVMWLLKQYYGDEIVFMADTGVASLNMPDGIGMGTGHSILSLPTQPANDYHYRKVSQKTSELLGKSDKIKVIVIDEAFGYNSDILDVIWKRIERFNKGTRKRKRRNIRLLLVGDPAQKTPIIKDNDRKEFAKRWGHPYMFKSTVWGRFNFTTYCFDTVERQSDKVFKSCLDVIRYQQTSRYKKCLEWLNQRYTGTYPENEVVLCATNKKVDAINKYYLERCEGDSMHYDNCVKGKFNMNDVIVRREGVTLAEGLRVMLVKNLFDLGPNFVNGLTGVVSLIESNGAWIDFDDGSKEFIGYERWENKDYYFEPETNEEGVEVEVLKEKVSGSLEAIPLLPSHAITISKVQGLTISTNFTIDMQEPWYYTSPRMKEFGTSLLYIAMSRSVCISKINLATKIVEGHIKGCVDSINFWHYCVENNVLKEEE